MKENKIYKKRRDKYYENEKTHSNGNGSINSSNHDPSVPVMAADGGKVYYLNFKPEADEAWQNLAKAYTEETGTEVTVVTAASGQYETTLQSEMDKERCSDTVPGKRTGWT